MIQWRNLPGERTELYNPIGLRPIDELAGGFPLGKVKVNLDLKDSKGDWQVTGTKPVITQGGVISFPGLGRRAEFMGQPPRHYRVRLEAELYRPLYSDPKGTEGQEFDAFPYNDANPPQKLGFVLDVAMKPAAGYPFPGHLLVLRGSVRDPVGLELSDILISAGTTQSVLSDERGEFALPLSRVQKSTPISVTAEELSGNRKGTITVNIPEDLGKNHTITIT